MLNGWLVPNCYIGKLNQRHGVRGHPVAKPETHFSEHEKERMRAEINDQVAEFLKRGGKIDVLTKEQRPATNIGSVWHPSHDMPNLVP